MLHIHPKIHSVAFNHFPRSATTTFCLSFCLLPDFTWPLFCNEHATGAIPSVACFSEERREWFALWHKKGKNSEKLSKTYEKYEIFWANRSFLRAMRLNHERITHVSFFYKMTTAIRLRSLILKSDESYSLTVALFWRVTRVNRSQSLFTMSDFERKSKEQKRKFPTLQIPWIWPRNQSTRRDWMTTKKQDIKNLTVNNNKLQFPKECVAKTSDSK